MPQHLATESAVHPRISRFRRVATEGPLAPPTPEELSAVEVALGTTLPDAYRAFLDVGNGGYVEYVVAVPSSTGTHEMSFCQFLSTRQDGAGSLLHALERARRQMCLPEGVLPIAQGGDGSILFLDLSPEGAGRVVASVTALPPWTGSGRDSEVVEVAPSFGAFVDALRLDREAILDHLEHDVFEQDDVDALESRLCVGLPRWREDAAICRAVERARARFPG